MARPRKYKTGKQLERAIDAYFASISRTVVLKESVPTGRYTEKGRPIMEQVPMLNDAGEEITRLEYVVPPSMGDLCLWLGISRETWNTYCDPNMHPEFLDTTTRARARVEAYLEQQLVTREKSVQGIIFNLQNNYGWKEKKELDLGKGAVQAVAGATMTMDEKLKLLREMAGEIHLPGDEE